MFPLQLAQLYLREQVNFLHVADCLSLCPAWKQGLPVVIVGIFVCWERCQGGGSREVVQADLKCELY